MSLRNWYRRNDTKITWFVIGWLSLSAAHDFAQGNWGGLALDLGLIILILYLNKKSV